MAILESISGRFDESLKADKVSTLQALIFASKNVNKYKLKNKNTDKELKRYEKIVVRTIEGLDLYRTEGRNTYGGPVLEEAVQFISGDITEDKYKQLKTKFNKVYQDGGSLGIWSDSELNLSPLAKRVADHEITMTRYLSIIFLNLFSFSTQDGKSEPKYFHFLERLIDYIQVNKLEDSQIGLTQLSDVYFNFVDDTTQEHKDAQNRALFQYLVGTYYFVDCGKYEFRVHKNWKNNLSLLKEMCNDEYKDLSLEEAVEKFNTRLKRSESALTLGDNTFEKEITRISEGLEEELETYTLTKLQNRIQIDQPYQQIYSGAPGTGKSFELNELAEKYFNINNEILYERVTFHPNMNYGQFVGVFKTFPSGIQSAPVTYKFVPGTLLRQLENAYKYPNKNFLILIEEINRANVASVFGDTFQLLDRKDGESEYPISMSEDIKYRFFDKDEGIFKDKDSLPKDVKSKLQAKGLFFPKNLFIWSTMNGADQGVMPMDTAFKRRWEFVKFGVNDIPVELESFFEDKYIVYKGGHIHWNNLRMAINDKLLSLNISEDKLIGPYFISMNALKDKEKLTESFKSKVLLYLFEDVMKVTPQRLFNFRASEIHYSLLVSKFENDGLDVFVDLGMDSK
ncbi:AAA domain-containing protein [Aerococcaceae bacterium WS4759]|uniref:AAA domain-containing protein n=1 Tax=Fundicoccus ignavus TaxID=2664442 RepID=A0A6I2GKY8_9LACT|nr:AAA family ATPase [Fundicoccus ignavus]MRI86522.1 AAA domain-containing protein [Fundicoccus ignavus]